MRKQNWYLCQLTPGNQISTLKVCIYLLQPGYGIKNKNTFRSPSRELNFTRLVSTGWIPVSLKYCPGVWKRQHYLQWVLDNHVLKQKHLEVLRRSLCIIHAQKTAPSVSRDCCEMCELSQRKMLSSAQCLACCLVADLEFPLCTWSKGKAQQHRTSIHCLMVSTTIITKWEEWTQK